MPTKTHRELTDEIYLALDPEERSHYTTVEAAMYEGDTLWDETELVGATKRSGMFLPVTAYSTSKGTVTTVVNERGFSRLLEAIIFSGLWRDAEDAECAAISAEYHNRKRWGDSTKKEESAG